MAAKHLGHTWYIGKRFLQIHLHLHQLLILKNCINGIRPKSRTIHPVEKRERKRSEVPVWRLKTGDHKVLRQFRISKQSPICSHEQDLATQWIQAYPCKTKTSQRNPEKLAKVPGTREESQSHLH